MVQLSELDQIKMEPHGKLQLSNKKESSKSVHTVKRSEVTHDIMDETQTSTETSADSDYAYNAEAESVGSVSPITWDMDQNSQTPSTTSDMFDFDNQGLIVAPELDSDSSSTTSSGLAQNIRTRAQRAAQRQRNLESVEDSSSSSSAVDVTENWSRSSLPRDEQSADVSEPPAKVRKLDSPIPEANDDNDGETCPICLESWGNSGDHRLVALKCGHLFGYKCVERWIRGKNSKERSCPTCKSKASIKDIRYIYAKRLVAVDTTELTALQKQVDTIQSEKNLMQIELMTTKIEHRSMSLQLELFRKTIENGNQSRKPLFKRNWRFALEKNLEVWRGGGCRVLAYNCRTYEFYVSQKATNNLFPGYGLRPVSCIDYKMGPFISLHPKAIRDVAYSQPTDLLMTVGLDGAVKFVERGILTKSIQCGMPLWSCAWDHARPNHFYIGGVGGIIMSYDVRNTNSIMETISTPGDMSPSVSLVSTKFGLLSSQLNSAWLWKSTVADAKPQPIPIKGPIVSLCYDDDSKRVAISCRPVSMERGKVALFKINKNDSDEVSFQLEENMNGSCRSTIMSRASFVKCSDSSWVAAYSETDSALVLHPLDGSRMMTLPSVEPALDVCSGQVNGETMLAALSECRLRLYKSFPTNAFK